MDGDILGKSYAKSLQQVLKRYLANKVYTNINVLSKVNTRYDKDLLTIIFLCKSKIAQRFYRLIQLRTVDLFITASSHLSCELVFKHGNTLL